MKSDGMPQSGPMTERKKGSASDDDLDILEEVKKRFKMCGSAEGENRKEALDDLQFLKGNQWPEKQRRQRESEGRPCLTINKLPTFLQQVTNDQRQNQAGIKVSAVSDSADPDTAEIIQGMIRHIEYASAASVAYDTAVNSAAAIGFGYFRLITEHEEENSFDQVIRFKRIRNSFTVSMDPASVEPDGSDQQFCIVTEKMTKAEFKARYPDAEITIQGFDNRSLGDADAMEWIWEDMVRVAEYYRVEFETATLYQLVDGTTSWDKPQDKMMIKAQRESTKRKVMWYKITPLEVLEEVEIKCKWIPVFPVYGTEIDIDGKVFRAGLIRNAKDPAMMYNFWMTSATEEVSLRPKTPYIGAEGAFEGHESKWRQANNRSYPYLEYKPTSVDGQLVPPPSRQPMVDVPVGVLAMASHAADNVKSTTGLFDSSLGAAGNAQSGKQELAQQKQGNVANFHYTDNLNITLRHAGKCLINMIPNYYDAQRVVQIRGEDGTSEHAEINKWDEVAQRYINDVTVGKYDVAVSVGPSYATMRAEAADAMIQFGQSWPKLMDIAGDKVVKAMNWPGAEAIAERIERTIPDNIRYDPKDPDAKPQFPPEAQQQIQQLNQQVQQLTEEADKNKAGIQREQIKAEAIKEVAQINSESHKDVEEIKGMVRILTEQMSIATAASEVTSNAMADIRATAEGSNSGGDMEKLVSMLSEALGGQTRKPSKRRMSIQAPSGAMYTGDIEDVMDEQPEEIQVPQDMGMNMNEQGEY